MCNVVFISKMIHLYEFNMPMFGGYVIDKNHVYFFIKKYIRCRYQVICNIRTLLSESCLWDYKEKAVYFC